MSETPAPLPDGWAERVARIEARLEIQELVVQYGLAVDDQDFDLIERLWAPDGVLREGSGRVKGASRQEISDYYRTRFVTLSPSNHFSHGVVLSFDDQHPDIAHGVVASHAELWRDGRAMITALRYLDTYVHYEGAWRFSERVQTFMYFLGVEEYASALGAERPVRAGQEWAARDWP